MIGSLGLVSLELGTLFQYSFSHNVTIIPMFHFSITCNNMQILNCRAMTNPVEKDRKSGQHVSKITWIVPSEKISHVTSPE